MLGMITTQVLWGENKPNWGRTENETIWEAMKELKKREVLCIGIIESFYQAVLNIYLFSWTPILQNSTTTGINVGFIFTCFIISLILGTTVFEIVMIYLRVGFYNALSTGLVSLSFVFFAIFYVDNFMVRFWLLLYINGSSGFLNPLISIIKSRILVEKYRALLMSIFRVPLNAYVIIVLLFVRYMDPFDVT
jgi:hypothetical protein